jgi:hypothetical protein
MKLLTAQFSPVNLVLLVLIISRALFSQISLICVLPLGSKTTFHTHKSTGGMFVLQFLILWFLDMRRETSEHSVNKIVQNIIRCC